METVVHVLRVVLESQDRVVEKDDRDADTDPARGLQFLPAVTKAAVADNSDDARAWAR
jgi:hypothetical protein